MGAVQPHVNYPKENNRNLLVKKSRGYVGISRIQVKIYTRRKVKMSKAVVNNDATYTFCLQ